MEEWKSVKGFEDYEVSNLGNVKSLKYGKERILKHSENNGGYLSIVLSLKGKLTTKPIHILVSESFLGHVACGNKYVVNHKDFDRKNNKKDNVKNIITILKITSVTLVKIVDGRTYDRIRIKPPSKWYYDGLKIKNGPDKVR